MRVSEDLVALGMRKLAEQSAELAALPDPAAIWWRSQWLERRAAEERALRPIAIAQKAAWTVAALGLAGSAAWYWPAIQPYAAARWLLPLGLGMTLLAAAAALLTAAPRDLPPESGGRP